MKKIVVAVITLVLLIGLIITAAPHLYLPPLLLPRLHPHQLPHLRNPLS
jgi:hypothetical protein